MSTLEIIAIVTVYLALVFFVYGVVDELGYAPFDAGVIAATWFIAVPLMLLKGFGRMLVREI